VTAKVQDVENARWDDVRVFLAVFRQRSLGGGARQLGVDTSTVSRRLAALEASLGTRLFDRTKQGLVATRAAQAVLLAAEAMESAHARLSRDAASIDAAAEGVVRLSVAPGMADAFIAPALVALRARHPGLRIELDASVRALDLERREADIAVRSIRPRGAGLVITRIGTGRWRVATGRALARRLGRVGAWHQAPWITWDQDLATMGPARWLTRHVPDADVALRTSHFASQLAAADAGLGFVLAPEAYIAVRSLALIDRPDLPGAADLPSDDLWLVGYRGLRSVPRVAAVWTFLLETLRASFGAAP
jgi:DNA-binding transcriptional LysR family regulator